MEKLTLKVVSNIEDVVAKVVAAQRYFEAAPDSDPLKQDMAAFGVIDIDRDMVQDVRCDGGRIVVDVSFAPDLQRLMDRVPA